MEEKTKSAPIIEKVKKSIYSGDTDSPIIGIGILAIVFEALVQFFVKIPENTRMSFV